MDKRRAPRLLPGPESTVDLRLLDGGSTIHALLLDQSVDGIAVQAGRRSTLAAGDSVQIRIGEHWEEAVVVSSERKGVLVRVGIKWRAEYQEPLLEKVVGPA